MNKGPITSDYFAELFVAGLLADKGWNIYFPHRDHGFDFIISKNINGEEIIRPVQVKGKYPFVDKKDKAVYGFVGKLSKLHTDMLLIIPYFHKSRKDGCDLVAFMKYSEIKKTSNGFKCQPASFKNGEPKMKKEYSKYFDEQGLELIEQS